MQQAPEQKNLLQLKLMYSRTAGLVAFYNIRPVNEADSLLQRGSHHEVTVYNNSVPRQ